MDMTVTPILLRFFVMYISSEDVDDTESGVLHNVKVRPVLVLRQHIIC